ncbi:MAG: DUF1707 domain-containing protein [Streptosporangiaceae bacterium]
MAGPGDEMAAGAAGRGYLRASHADREQVIDALKTAFVRGVLAKDEFDLRVGLTLASRTNAELAALTADLPAKLAAAQPPEPVRAQRERPVRTGRVITVATALCASMWAFTLLFLGLRNSEGDLNGAIILVTMLTLAYFYVLAVVVGVAVADRRGKRSGGQPPVRPAPGAGGQAGGRPPSADPGGQLAPVDRRHRDAAEGARSRPPRAPWPGSRSLCRGHSFLRRYAIGHTGL